MDGRIFEHNFATDSQFDSNANFDWSILKHEFHVFIQKSNVMAILLHTNDYILPSSLPE